VGNLLLLNFGTYVETNRFKAQALQHGFLARDAMYESPPGPLIKQGGVRTVNKVGGADAHSFLGLTRSVWKGKLRDDRRFYTAFQDWMNKVLAKPVSCVYLTGHHWDDEARGRHSILSWGEDTDHFHARFDRDKNGLAFGVTGRRVDVDTKNLRSDCRLVLGFGCNIATALNSRKYHAFFGSPVVLSWDRSITIPPAKGPSVNERFFSYLADYASKNAKVPRDDRLEWFYANEPMELVRAWGFATIVWLSKQARARDNAGNFYKFKVDAKKQTAVPQKI
jgi:hypothetical protein